MTETSFKVITPHVSEFPEPIDLKQGDIVSVGRRYDGPEDWGDWYLCSTPEQNDGWVPAQVIDFDQAGYGVIKEDYCARELNTTEGDLLIRARVLNGWIWATRMSDGATGWVPAETVRACDPGTPE